MTQQVGTRMETMETRAQDGVRAKIVWAMIVLCLLALVWQCIATWYWWPRIRSTVENTAALSDFDIASLRRFDRVAIYVPGALQMIGLIWGSAMIGAKSVSRKTRFGAALLVGCGIGGLALAGYTVVRGILDLA